MMGAKILADRGCGGAVAMQRMRPALRRYVDVVWAYCRWYGVYRNTARPLYIHVQSRIGR
jgi:hypothetical protein